MLNVLYAGCSGLSLVILVQFALKLHVTAKNCQKVHKTLFWHSRSSKVIAFGANQKPAWDFLLVINSNRGPILHCFWDTVTLAGNRKFFPPILT